MLKAKPNNMSNTQKKKVDVNLEGAQITMLIPLLGRAIETRKNNGLLQDDKAVEIISSLDYDFSKWQKTPSLIGACIRTLIFDKMVSEFIQQHPTGTVVEIGCGMNTRFERLDNGTITWFDLDLPEVIDLRRHFFTDSSRRTMIAASVLETAWFEQVKSSNGPYFFISEAVIIYLSNSQAKQAITQIMTQFDTARFALDTASADMVKNQHKHDAMRHLPTTSWFKWACDDPKEIESWQGNLRLIETKTFFDADEVIINKLPLAMRVVMRYFPFLIRKKIENYHLNLFG